MQRTIKALRGLPALRRLGCLSLFSLFLLSSGHHLFRSSCSLSLASFLSSVPSLVILSFCLCVFFCFCLSFGRYVFLSVITSLCFFASCLRMSYLYRFFVLPFLRSFFRSLLLLLLFIASCFLSAGLRGRLDRPAFSPPVPHLVLVSGRHLGPQCTDTDSKGCSVFQAESPDPVH